MTTLQQREAAMPRTSHPSHTRFWAMTIASIAAILATTGIVALTAGGAAGRIVLISTILLASCGLAVDGIVVFRRRHRRGL